MKRASNELMLGLINLLISESNACAEKLLFTERNNSEEVCFLLFDRIFQGMSSLEILMSFEKKRKTVYNGAAIIMRSLLSDCPYGFELYNLLKSDGELDNKVAKINLLIRNALLDGHIHSLKYFERLEAENKISAEDLLNIKNTTESKIQKINPSITVEDVLKMKPIQVTKWLKENSHYDVFHRTENAYKTFSQVEHFGGLYSNWLEFNMDKRFDLLMESIFLCAEHLRGLIYYMARQVKYEEFFLPHHVSFVKSLNYYSERYSTETQDHEQK